MNTPMPIMTVSGVRGIFNESLTEKFYEKLGYTHAKTIKARKMLIGRDSRPSGLQALKAITRGMHQAGCTVIDLGIVPTPTVCVAVAEAEADGGVIISASHNPAQYNGYKMVHRQGRIANAEECQQVYYALEHTTNETVPGQQSETPDEHWDPTDVHIQRIVNAVDVAAIKKAKIRVAVDAINGAASEIFKKLLKYLEVDFIAINDTPDGNFTHNPEPRPQHLGELAAAARATRDLWACFAFDPDADRLAPMGENGEEISEEMTLALSLQTILKQVDTDIATNLSTNMIIDDVVSSFGKKVFRSKIGEANVVSCMKEHNCLAGGEGNGGVIFPKISTVRDGLAAMALILQLMAHEKKKITELVAQWPTYAIAKHTIDAADKDISSVLLKIKVLYTNYPIDDIDGVKVTFPQKGWVHLRASNTEPILRCYAEAKTSEQAEAIAREVMDQLQ